MKVCSLPSDTVTTSYDYDRPGVTHLSRLPSCIVIKHPQEDLVSCFRPPYPGLGTLSVMPLALGM